MTGLVSVSSSTGLKNRDQKVYNKPVQKKQSKLKTINLVSVIFFLLASAFYLVHEIYFVSGQQKVEQFVTVSAVNDGDTVSVIVNKKQEKVRLIGIDAPEIVQKPWGWEAKKFLESVMSSSGWRVRLEFDVDKRDKYGRILAYLRTADGKLVNLLLVKGGYAMIFTLPPNVRYSSEFRTAQQEAREGRLGIWSEKGLKERPADYRKEHPRI